MLLELHLRYPVYGFNAHAGYGTPQHLAALREHGPCEHHRRSFAPVREAHLRLGTGVPLPAVDVIVMPGGAFQDALADDAFGERGGI
jgi:ribonuclease HII